MKPALSKAIPIASFYFFYFWATGVFIIFIPKALATVGYSALQIGILLSVFPLVKFLLPFAFMRTYKMTKTLFLIALCASALIMCGFLFTYASFYPLLINATIFALFLSLTLPYADFAALQFVKEKFGYVRMFGSIGFILSGTLLAYFFSGTAEIFFCYAAGIIAIGISGFFLAANMNEKTSTYREVSAKRDYRLYRKDLLFWLSMICMQLSFGAFYTFFTLFELQHHLTIRQITLLWGVSIVVEITMFLVQNTFIKKFSPFTLIQFCVFATLIRWLLLDFFPGNFYVALASQLMHAFSFALFTTAAFLFIFSRYRNKKVAQMQFYGLSYGLGGFLGSLISGALYGEHIFLYASLIAGISLILIMLYRPKPIRNQPRHAH